MFIAVPTGVKIFNWLATLWGGKLTFTTPMKFAVALVAMFTIGGLSGVTHAISPSDLQQTDTYYIVAHFHYVIFGGALLGFFGGLYFWWPKAFGHRLSEGLGYRALLADDHRHEPDVRADAHRRDSWASPGVPTPTSPATGSRSGISSRRSARSSSPCRPSRS
jgi:hypothetical protein